MGETTSEDRFRKWWGRLRIPAGLFVIISIVIRSLGSLGSGDPRIIVGTLVWVGFWAWLFFRPLGPRASQPPSADELRARSRPMLIASGFWTAAFVLVVAWSVLERGYLRPSLLVVVALPLLLLLPSWFGFVKADWIARRTAEAHARRS